MNFLAPAAFWFLATIPVVVVFYLLKRRRKVHIVPSTLLWQRFLAESQANAPFQRLRHNWLLLLQILLLLLAIFALSRPFFAGETKTGLLHIIILDASASMQSTDEAPNRFEKARKEALALVDTLRDSESMVVLVSGAVTDVRQSATGNKAALRRAIEAAKPVDSPTRLRDALKLAQTLTLAGVEQKEGGASTNAPSANSVIHLFTDGAVGDLGEFANKGLNLVYHRVGQRGNNAGIVSLDLRENPENRRQRALYTAVANYATNAVDLALDLRFEDQSVEARPIHLEAGETVPLVFLADQSKDGAFELRLTSDDDLAVDNSAFIPSLLPHPIHVLLVSRGNRFLEKALRAAPRVELTTAATLDVSATGFDLVVLDDVMPSTWPKGPTLAIRAMAPGWFDTKAPVENPAVVDWKGTHPLLRYVNFDAVQIAEAVGVATPSWGITILESTRTPLIVAGELEGHRLVWIGFDTLNSTWPLRISFPIFIANAVEWLDPQSAQSSLLVVRPGDPFRLPVAEGVTQVELTKPDGEKKTLEVAPGQRELVIGDTAKSGLYHVMAGTNSVTFAASLLDSAESNTKPREQLDLGRMGELAADTQRRSSKELWRWIAAGALGVLMFEWWFYHKRTA
jgi:Ca-activated chloride channel family protein